MNFELMTSIIITHHLLFDELEAGLRLTRDKTEDSGKILIAK